MVLSDHGQSQGATFLQRYGMRLEDLVQQQMRAGAEVAAATHEQEQWGRVNTLLTEVTSEGGMAGSGWQSRAVLIHPADWPVAGHLVGADSVHHQLVAWLERLGQRRQLPQMNRTVR